MSETDNQPDDVVPVIMQKDFRGEGEARDFRPLPERHDEEIEASDPKGSSAPERADSSLFEMTGNRSNIPEPLDTPASAEKESETKEDEENKPSGPPQTSSRTTSPGSDGLPV